MAVSGFEGFEKRLELHFSGDDPTGNGLRRLSPSAIQLVLDAIQCSIVSAVGNRFFDAYVLSESSLFVYPHKIIIKTCGTTRLLMSLPLLLRHVAPLGLRLLFCRYSRGSFIFPHAQPFPHSDFWQEVGFLENHLPPNLSYRKAAVLPSETPHSWHVYSAADIDFQEPESFTVEVCMTELNRKLARAFRHAETTGVAFSGDEVGREMSGATGIDGINPRSLVFGFAFEPCGYSMNGLDGDRYSTVHVTPEDGYSYASFECVGDGFDTDVAAMIGRVVRVFGPGTVSVSVCGCGAGRYETVWSAIAGSVESMGFDCWTRVAEEFPGAGEVTYQTFTACCK